MEQKLGRVGGRAKDFKVSAKNKQLKTSKKGLQRPAARYDGIGKIGGGYSKKLAAKLAAKL